MNSLRVFITMSVTCQHISRLNLYRTFVGPCYVMRMTLISTNPFQASCVDPYLRGLGRGQLPESLYWRRHFNRIFPFSKKTLLIYLNSEP